MQGTISGSVSRVLGKFQELEAELEKELASRRKSFRYTLDKKKVTFEKSVLQHHRRLRTGVLQFIRESRLSFILTAPVIYAGIIPLAMTDVFFTLYQYICFPVYGIPLVRRGEYLVIDRHHLAYLNPIEKLNCVYCGYGNGVIAYAREIASRTEEFWCPIKHARTVHTPHHRYYEFLEYGDAEGFRTRQERKGGRHRRHGKNEGRKM